jgi:hypothetical protein
MAGTPATLKQINHNIPEESTLKHYLKPYLMESRSNWRLKGTEELDHLRGGSWGWRWAPTCHAISTAAAQRATLVPPPAQRRHHAILWRLVPRIPVLPRPRGRRLGYGRRRVRTIVACTREQGPPWGHRREVLSRNRPSATGWMHELDSQRMHESDSSGDAAPSETNILLWDPVVTAALSWVDLDLGGVVVWIREWPARRWRGWRQSLMRRSVPRSPTSVSLLMSRATAATETLVISHTAAVGEGWIE